MLASLIGFGPVRAQSPPPVAIDPAVTTTPGIDPTEMADGDVGRTSGGKITPLVAPVPFKHSQLGWGLAVLVGAIHRFDPDTTLKPSTGVVGGFYSDNKSWGVMVMELARLAKDTWRLRGLYTHADVRYDFYGIGEAAGEAGISVPLGQKMDFTVGSVLRRVMPGLYAGAGVLWMRSTVRLRRDLPPELPLDPEGASGELFATGLQAELDTRDDDYWPTAGSLAYFKGWFFLDALGSPREFQRYAAAWSWYTRLRSERAVLAANANLASAAGEVPFYLLPAIGVGRGGLRGYTQGRYRDRVMITLQTELRLHSEGRFGATVFGGLGQVAPGWSDLPDAAVLPAGGVGLRYKLTREFPMHLRLDYAWGRGDQLLYFSVAEAF
jgi:hypothetical protein